MSFDTSLRLRSKPWLSEGQGFHPYNPQKSSQSTKHPMVYVVVYTIGCLCFCAFLVNENRGFLYVFPLFLRVCTPFKKASVNGCIFLFLLRKIACYRDRYKKISTAKYGTVLFFCSCILSFSCKGKTYCWDLSCGTKSSTHGQ